MTGAELERIARELVPAVGATSVTLEVDHVAGVTHYRVAWLVDGRRRVPVGPAFERARDARQLMDHIAGVPAPRSAQPTALVDVSESASAGPSGAPELLSRSAANPADVPGRRVADQIALALEG